MSWRMIGRYVASLAGIAWIVIGTAFAQTSQLANISTRGQVLTGNSVMIAGFVVQGAAQTVVIRARGPSLVPFGIADALFDPTLDLVRSADQAVLQVNDDWELGPNAGQIADSGFAPGDPFESAIFATLPPGAYTAIVRGFGGTTGVAIVEVFAVQGTVPPPGGLSPAGIYTGTSSAGNTVLGMVTDGGPYFFLHTPPSSPQAVVAVDMAPGFTVSGLTLSSSTEVSVAPLEYVSASGLIAHDTTLITVGNMSGSFSPTALSATFTYLPTGTTSVSTTFVGGSDEPASLSTFPGAFSGSVSYTNIGTGHSRFDWAPVGTVTVGADGTLTGTLNCHMIQVGSIGAACGLAGTLVPRADIKAFDVTVSFTEANGGRVAPQLRGKTFTGMAFRDPGTGRLTFVATNPDNNLIVFSSLPSL